MQKLVTPSLSGDAWHIGSSKGKSYFLKTPYQGEVQHRDSSGGGGKIGAGDVQWMTAGNGIVHEEFHSQDFIRKGGTFQMAQLWVNLRAQDKSANAGYQTMLKAQIPN